MALKRKPVVGGTYGSPAQVDDAPVAEAIQVVEDNSGASPSGSTSRHEGVLDGGGSSSASHNGEGSGNQAVRHQRAGTDDSSGSTNHDDEWDASSVGQSDGNQGGARTRGRSRRRSERSSDSGGARSDQAVRHQRVGTDDSSGSVNHDHDYRLDRAGGGSQSRDTTSTATLGPTEARRRVEQAALLARRRPDDQVNAPLRVTKREKKRLNDRRRKDHESADFAYKLALSNYHNAAIEIIPEDISEAIRWAEEYEAEWGLQHPPTVGTTTRLHKDNAKVMSRLSSTLPAKARHGLVTMLVSAAFKRLLDALDKGDYRIVDLDAYTQGAVRDS